MPHDYYRILIAKVGLDGHDRGAKVVVRALRDAGFEVIYTGLHQTPAQVVKIALQEDVDAIGVSILSGSHIEHFRQIVNELKQKDMNDVVLFGGGVIPNSDLQELMDIGVQRIFQSKTKLEEIPIWLSHKLEH